MNKYDILIGDSKEKLLELSPSSIHCCITSPPYFGLRNYDVEGQVGLEETPQEYIQHLVDIFQEVHRVLRDDGTLWVVIGDSYCTIPYGKNGSNAPDPKFKQRASTTQANRKKLPGLKNKDLIGIPWSFAFAMRSAGWYLRQEVIWAKSISGPLYRGGSCMPESVRDRATRSYESIFMFSKFPKYYYDHEAIKEEAVSKHAAGNSFHRPERIGRGEGSKDVCSETYKKRNVRSVWHYEDPTLLSSWLAKEHPEILERFLAEQSPTPNVWNISIQAFKGAHFATFPEALVLQMVLAGTSDKGVCPECGAPWKRVIQKPTAPKGRSDVRTNERDGGLTTEQGMAGNLFCYLRIRKGKSRQKR